MQGRKEEVKVDIIVLGFTLTSLLTAYNLKKKLKDLDIIVLDLSHELDGGASKAHVSFYSRKTTQTASVDGKVDPDSNYFPRKDDKIQQCLARKYLKRYAKDLNIEFAEGVMLPEEPVGMNQIFQRSNGNVVTTKEQISSFKYLNYVEWFEISQFQLFLDYYVDRLFCGRGNDDEIKGTLQRFDNLSVASVINEQMFFKTSIEYMKTLVRMQCGIEAEKVPALHYLSQHRLWRGGRPTRTLERIQQHCRQRLVQTLIQLTDQLTYRCGKITRIRKYPNKQVIIETGDDEPQYICGVLAVAVSPDQLIELNIEPGLVDPERLKPIERCQTSFTRKFSVSYDVNFWRESGYSGQILSLKGPIIWAMEKPKLSGTGSAEKYFSIVGVLDASDINDPGKMSYERDVIDQLTTFFGEEAQTPVEYREVDVSNVMVPVLGDVLANYSIVKEASICGGRITFSPLNYFKTGDAAASIEAAHMATLQIVDSIRPQAASFSSITLQCGEHSLLPPLPLKVARATFTVRVAIYAIVAFAAYSLSWSVAAMIVELVPT